MYNKIIIIRLVIFIFTSFFHISAAGSTAALNKIKLLNERTGSTKEILFRTDKYAGPALFLNGRILDLKMSEISDHFEGKTDSIKYSLTFKKNNNGKMQIRVNCINISNINLSDIQFSCQLGIDTEMHSYPQWHSVFFPTLMRCERTHFWGYFMSPGGRVLSISSPDAVASYRLLYNNSSKKVSFENGHRIYTVSLDLINPRPLPERNPKLHDLKAGESKTWSIMLEELNNLEDLPASIATSTNAPFIQSEFYTLSPNDTTVITIKSIKTPSVSVRGPLGEIVSLKFKSVGRFLYKASFVPNNIGVYKFSARNSFSKTSEMMITCREKKYSDYIKAARVAALHYSQKPNSNAESWYGLFSGYIARQFFPDSILDSKIDSVFFKINSLTYNTDLQIPLNNPSRIQDVALKASLWVQRYKVTNDLDDLRWASNLCDYLIHRQVVEGWDKGYSGIFPDGSYKCNGTHYTSVIYIAKGIMDVMEYEKVLAESSPEWSARYKRHYASVKLAMDDLATNLDNIHTEGEMTFEDGMISCSYTQLSQFALLQPEGSELRKYYTDAAIKLLQMHRCLSQLIVPDSRMNGGSLRYWESQYDILTMPNMMNSPHGWSAWRIYGLRNLYLLTGNFDYLKQMINSIGSCIQLINPKTNNLNWAFVPDPYIVAQRFVPAQNGKGKHVEQIIGEQYLPMISDWYKADNSKICSPFWGMDGGCNDNDVHEIFKCLGEILLSSAYVHEDNEGRYFAHNCSVFKEGDILHVTTNESCINKVHVNLKYNTCVVINKSDNTVTRLFKGWVSVN